MPELETDLPAKEEIIKYYNERLDNSRTDYNKVVTRSLDRLNLAPKRTVLELGCGCGANSLYLARQGCKVTAVDFADQRIGFARQESKNKNIEYLCKDVLELDLERQFDIITAIGLMHHIDPARFQGFVETILRHAHSRTLVYLTLPISYFLAFGRHFKVVEQGILDSQIPLSLVISALDAAGFTPMEVNSFGTVSPYEHWEIMFITKHHMNDVWQEIYEIEPPTVELPAPEKGVEKSTQEDN